MNLGPLSDDEEWRTRMGLTVPPPPYYTGKYRRCNYCQTNFGAEHNNCPHCGAYGYVEFAVPDTPMAKPPQPRSDNTRPRPAPKNTEEWR